MGADVNPRSGDGWTALHSASIWGHKDMTELLLASGAEVSVRATGGWAPGWTPLHMAVRHSHGPRIELAQSLIGRGAQLDAQDELGRTPLHIVAHYGHKELAACLLENGANINIADNDGETPLHLTVKADRNEVAQLLRAHGGRD